MSNAQKKTSGSFSLADYKAKAKKVADEKGPFPLAVDVDRTIEIPWPNASTILSVEEAENSRTVLTLLCGDSANEIFELFGSDEFGALSDFTADLRKHFGL